MSGATVHVSGIAPTTTEKEVRDFFSFCGKITSLSITPSSAEAGAPQTASVTFEKDAAAKTALLLDQTQLGSSSVHVEAASQLDDIAGAQATNEKANEDEHEIPQEDKPRSRIAAEYLAHGYVLSDNALKKAIELDQKHGISTRFTDALSKFDAKYNATERAKSLDQSYQISNKAGGAWAGLSHYFEKALEHPTGQKLRDFYIQTDKQVRDIHNEARRLADLKSGKTESDSAAPAPSTAATVVPPADAAGAAAPH
ncbi:hypothetical protein N7468_006014 [Penicillium chermesinum]|uniref:RRM domain-containing protein n=1 Tax=Penicillium chermesinum TaxID=63820 RepID=A0A9W9P0D4_9EURO|nr:uncharacterized protein N7468_006014 [Penicillium chermesinum]KAJ5233058.1 hypothetical protein N7468_006014 [Penicillium chermesinum]KAJ6172697.1 hypothetical protein N7470_001764 [Penicillium chermesinum]